MSIASQLNTFQPTVNVAHVVSYMYDNHELLHEWKSDLFNDESENCNRDMLTDARNIELTRKIKKFLPYLCNHFLNPDCSPIIEYMIRVYSINTVGVDDVILTFLPYYQSPNFCHFRICYKYTNDNLAQNPVFSLCLKY